MIDDLSLGGPAPSVNLRSVALPTEHGGWSFLLEPVVLGLVLAPTWPGLLLGIAALLAFLAHQPLRLAFKDRFRGQRLPRTPYAERFAAGYLLGAGVAFTASVLLAWQNGSLLFLLPLGLAVPLAAAQVWLNSRTRSRDLLAELAGASALGLLPVSLALLGGWSLLPASALWGLVLARGLPAILYVRARLQVERGKPVDQRLPAFAHLTAIVGAVGLAFAGLVGWTAIAATILLAVRSTIGLSKYRRRLRATQIGFSEVAYGVITVALYAAGFWRT
ncbi:MAG: YwiC-like family protein [Anaerolineae bacterium]|nr:YwiC-like family protein [Anaerolineae bacterium]